MINFIIIDDEEAIREGLKVIIDWQELGFNLVGDASNGEAALELIKNKKPHLVIVDIRMPVLSGIELMQKVRKERNDILFIILSGYDDFNYVQKAIELGALRYLLKPVEAFELKDAVISAAKTIKEQCKNEGIVNKFRLIVGEETYAREEEKFMNDIDSHESNNDLTIPILRIVKYINNHIDERLTLEDLSKIVFMHPNYLSQVFKNETGESLINYIMKLKVEKAKEYLEDEDLRLVEVASKVSYNNARYFSQLFKKYTGYYPSEYRKEFGKK